MQRIMDQPTVRLDAFDAAGRICGHAERSLGQFGEVWTVTTNCGALRIVQKLRSEAAAEEFLWRYGAKAMRRW